MKIYLIFIFLIVCSKSFAGASPPQKIDDLYAEWRKEIQIFQNKRSPRGVFLGYNMWDIKYFQKLEIFSKMISMDNKDLNLFLLNKIKTGAQGDEFLSFVICAREDIDIEKILTGSDNNLWNLPSEVIKLFELPQ